MSRAQREALEQLQAEAATLRANASSHVATRLAEHHEELAARLETLRAEMQSIAARTAAEKVRAKKAELPSNWSTWQGTVYPLAIGFGVVVTLLLSVVSLLPFAPLVAPPLVAFVGWRIWRSADARRKQAP